MKSPVKIGGRRFSSIGTMSRDRLNTTTSIVLRQPKPIVRSRSVSTGDRHGITSLHEAKKSSRSARTLLSNKSSGFGSGRNLGGSRNSNGGKHGMQLKSTDIERKDSGSGVYSRRKTSLRERRIRESKTERA